MGVVLLLLDGCFGVGGCFCFLIYWGGGGACNNVLGVTEV